MKRTWIIFVLINISFLIAENRVRIMQYNFENYGGDGYDYKNETSRNPYYRTVIEAIGPDIIVGEEIYGAHDADTRLMNDVLNYSENIYAAAFIDQKTDDQRNDVWQDIGVFYKIQMFREISKKEIEVAGGYLRDVLEVKLEYQVTKDTITIYGLHLKAGSGSSDQNERQNEAEKLRNYLNTLPQNTPFVVVGDFNIFNASEGAWQRLTETQDDNDGQVFDPVNQVGEWHSNENFKAVHTHSTRYSSFYPNSSGLRERLDFILISQGIMEKNKIEYIEESYVPFGNDAAHFGDSVNWQTNNMVSASIADALYNASDHLPVYADFDFTGKVEIDEGKPFADEFVLEQNYPNPFNPSTTISFFLPKELFITLNIYNLKGELVKSLTNGNFTSGRYSIKWNGKNQNNENLANGIYIYTLVTESGQKFSKKMILVK